MMEILSQNLPKKKKPKKNLFSQSKRGNNGPQYLGKANLLKIQAKLLFMKNLMILIIYIIIWIMKNLTIFYLNEFKNIDMNIKLFQKYYIQCLIQDNKISK